MSIQKIHIGLTPLDDSSQSVYENGGKILPLFTIQANPIQ